MLVRAADTVRVVVDVVRADLDASATIKASTALSQFSWRSKVAHAVA